jgi:hypothetical protein
LQWWIEECIANNKAHGGPFLHLIRDKIDQGGLHPLEQRLQLPFHPCAKRLARRD